MLWSAGRLSSQRPRAFVEGDARVVAGGDALGPNLLRHDEQLIELQMIVAKAAGNGRAPGKILLDERANHVALEALLVIDHVIRDADLLGHAARVVDIVERAAASLHGLGHTLASGQAALVPELHGQADDVVSLGAQHGRDGGRIHTARHGYGDGFGWQLLAPSF